jgi:two-component system, OmpR family, sensor histidine kinase ChvG
MTLAPGMDMRNPRPADQGEVVLGEDWVRPQATLDSELRDKRRRRGLISLNRSPLARKIIFFNLLALMVLVVGVLYLNPFRDSLVQQRAAALVTQAELIADAFSVRLAAEDGGALGPEAAADTLDRLSLRVGIEVYLFDATGQLAGSRTGNLPEPFPEASDREAGSTLITDLLNSIWEGVTGLMGSDQSARGPLDAERMARDLVPTALQGRMQVETVRNPEGNTLFTVATPVRLNGNVHGVVALTSAAGEIDRLVRSEREQVLQMFLLALLVSIGLSLVLASTIANPLSDLAAAAELGRDKNARKTSPTRVRIPDLTARPDEIGRLSVAMRGMVAALYDRIEANEQFAADVAHEIKNPLASLRSAVGTLRVARREDQREKLLDVIEHDVRRLDRLVSDISNASRLDSELVKEQEESFDLLRTLRNLCEYLGREASSKGIEFIADLPEEPIVIQGLEARLAQVFVNLISNAISFCEDGDAVRVWARRRDNRVLVVVEDTGPGIPESALTKVFKRFYSERPVKQFGNHSGLGLAISKQIVEAHGGVIWAENIRPTDADVTSEPLGARFVVGLPL